VTDSAAPAKSADVEALAQALGGHANLASIEVFSTRLKLTLRDGSAVDEGALSAAGFRGVVRVAESTWHVIVGPDAESAALALRAN
jgi:PTS system N-acetylglucosamine-specific IIC component